MSTPLPSFTPALGIPAPSPPSSGKPDPKPASTNWWAPLFGWPSEPTHVAPTAAPDGGGDRPEKSGPEARKAGPRSRFAPGCFTEEKAKQLRRKTREGSSFHDAMYHSAIANRLAWD
ncbi:hypothetical protein EUGRSUZ_F02554 [Eucalyptus grandis]|uniref:Uncharacterized protein n=2 Tax=Eucalyptus grandis TaxID=71139 RepID=A0ACC3KJ10_EUCGR|nr:hypothetical protein EUGRSUZ_F02554 [Eucalyptus grandis]